jgi:hypothetical protein
MRFSLSLWNIMLQVYHKERKNGSYTCNSTVLPAGERHFYPCERRENADRIAIFSEERGIGAAPLWTDIDGGFDILYSTRMKSVRKTVQIAQKMG